MSLADRFSDDHRVGILIKWGKPCHLQGLLNGILYLNTPEFYRMQPNAPFGDPNESCGYSYRNDRDPAPPTFAVDGRGIGGITSVTATMGRKSDSYLHCWTALTIPRDDVELRSIKRNFRRMRDAFGLDYVALRRDDLPGFIERIEHADGRRAAAGLVTYSDDRNLWGPLCKDIRFRHQREFRFLVGPCGTLDETPKKLFLGDLRSMLSLNIDLGLLYEGKYILDMRRKAIY